MSKLLTYINPFVVLSISFISAIFLVKITELLISSSEISSLAGMIYGNLLSTSFICLCFLIFYLIISLFSRKAAVVTSSLLFSLMFIFEVGLAFYHNTTGILMGNELITRPLWETVHTIKSVLNIWLVLGTIALIGGFMLLSIRLSKRKINDIVIIFVLLMMIISLPLIFILKPNQDKIIVNKTWYCVNSCITASKTDEKVYRLEFDKKYFSEYNSWFEDRDIVDNKYPLERNDNIENVLGEYFHKSTRKPNVVLIIVESLGSDVFGKNEYGFTATPFLDSLSKHSLLWTNCLSTTPRSSGVLPAVTASAPHGLRGFQFGDIPEHNSLFSILKDNGYKTNVFYAGALNFDRVYDYLIAQKIDFTAPFLYECQKNRSESNFDYTSWGYQDQKMLERSMEIIKKRDSNKNNFDVLITISQHERNFKLNNNKELEEYYYNKAHDIINDLPEKGRKFYENKVGFLAAFLYGDDALRDFFKSYNQLYDNSIFIITGDHSLNFTPNNPLNAFHVPLIIWSPMLNKSQHFNSVVSHNDITPSLSALLRDNFTLKTPNQVHWMSDGLNTNIDFNCELKTYFMRYSGNLSDCIFDNYYYAKENEKENIYLIKENLKLEKIEDEDIRDMMREKYETMLYIDRYVYANNRITKNPIIPRSNYEVVEEIYLDSIVCKTPSEKPSVAGNSNVVLYDTNLGDMYSEIKVITTAELKYTENVSHNFAIEYSVSNGQGTVSYGNFSKYILDEKIEENKWLRFESTSVFPLKKGKDAKFIIKLASPKGDIAWNPNHSVTLKDVRITFLGVR